MTHAKSAREVLEKYQDCHCDCEVKLCLIHGDQEAMKEIISTLRQDIMELVLYPNTVKKPNEKWLSGFMNCRTQLLERLEL